MNKENRIPLEQAIDLLRECSAVIIDDDILVYPSLHADEQAGERFLELSWSGLDGFDFELKFHLESQGPVQVRDGKLVLIDTEDYPYLIELLVPKPVLLN